MEKLLTKNKDCNISNSLPSFSGKTFVVGKFSLYNKEKELSKPKTLLDCVKYFSKVNDVEQDLVGISFGFENIVLNEELSDKKVRNLAEELAIAIDSNCVWRVKDLKKEYGNLKEFSLAKDFLNKKCKEVWNVFDSKIKNIPHEAMKALGITNKPDLETILGDSVRFYEKDGGNSTARIIASILSNENLDYSISDVHKFLKLAHEKEKFNCNLTTIEYLITSQNYDKYKLFDLGVGKLSIYKTYKGLSFKNKCRFIFNNLRNLKKSA